MGVLDTDLGYDSLLSRQAEIWIPGIMSAEGLDGLPTEVFLPVGAGFPVQYLPVRGLEPHKSGKWDVHGQDTSFVLRRKSVSVLYFESLQ